MTRIVAGSAGGRTLKVPGTGTRPTSDRVREALFSALGSMGAVDGAVVLDLYAGSGALGLEAASRGATAVTLVERAPRSARVVQDNVRTLGLGGIARVVTADVAQHLRAGPPAHADLVLLDPPYDLPPEQLDAVLALLVTGGHLAKEAIVVVERDRRSPAPGWPDGLEPVRERRYGDTTVHLAAFHPGPTTVDATMEKHR